MSIVLDASLTLARFHAELALRLKVPLATLDNDLRTAASRESVPLLGL